MKIRYEEEAAIWPNDEQIARYYDMAERETDAASFVAYHHLIKERNEDTGELETVLNEYIFYPFDVEGVHDETEELHVDVDSELGQFIREENSCVH